MHNQENDKFQEFEFDIWTISYKHKRKKLKFYENESYSSKDNKVKLHREKHINSSASSDNNPKRRKYKPYEEILGEFKKIKPPMFNGEVEKGEEVEAWLSRMKKYF